MQNSKAISGWYRPCLGISLSVTETSAQARGSILWRHKLSDESKLKQPEPPQEVPTRLRTLSAGQRAHRVISRGAYAVGFGP